MGKYILFFTRCAIPPKQNITQPQQLIRSGSSLISPLMTQSAKLDASIGHSTTQSAKNAIFDASIGQLDASNGHRMTQIAKNSQSSI